MDHVVAVAVLNRFQQLVDVAAHLVQLDAVRVLFQHLEQIFVQVFENQVETVAPNGGQVSQKSQALWNAHDEK